MSQQDRELNLPPIILGGSGFSYQVHPNPQTLPVSAIIRRAFDVGIRAIDTSPYYEPSEQLMGKALASPEVSSRYAREDYTLMTKVDRISPDEFNYSPDWIRHSVKRSLKRLGTSYLDVVFCHDVEFVSVSEAVEAVGVLFELSSKVREGGGQVKFVGISGYDLDRLVHIARIVQNKYGRGLDVVQNWAQLTLQNTRLEKFGIPALREAGVSVICSSSPLASGLLRAGGVPMGKLGGWHPAPSGLRVAVAKASEWVETQNETLAGLALRFSIAKAMRSSGIEQNVRDVHTILVPEAGSALEGDAVAEFDVLRLKRINEAVEQEDLALSHRVRQLLGGWVEYDLEKGKKKQEVSLLLWPGVSTGLVMVVSLLILPRGYLPPLLSHLRWW
ncbi:Aldo/keto reductase [Aspergillus falconensis]